MNAGTVVLSIDAMGGDAGPAPVLGGLERALRENERLRFLIHGDEEALDKILKRRKALAAVSEVRHAPDIVSMSDQPSQTLRRGRNSSMWHALQSVRNGEAGAAVSTGNTGALMAMSVMILRKAPGIDRPAIAIHWPSRHPCGFTTMLDVGADLRADAIQLSQHAVMGAEYCRLSLGIETPRVGLLNIGTEATKGPPELRDASEMIRDASLVDGADFTYAGFVEGTHIPTGDVDVIVTDGFTGNIALKTGEATASFIRDLIKGAFRHSVLSQIGYVFALTSLRRMRQRIDPRRVNGGVFLGLSGPVVKSHGSADALGFSAAVKLAARLSEGDFAGRITARLASLDLYRKNGIPLPGGKRQAT